MNTSITALFCCIDDFAKVFEDFERKQLIPTHRKRLPSGKLSYQQAHELILFWDAKLFHSGSNSGTPWHLKKGLAHVLIGIRRYSLVSDSHARAS